MDFPFIKEALSQLFSKPSCEMYVPDKTKLGAPNYRGRIVFHPDKCINCMMCERVCSGNAITHVIEKTPEGDDKVTRTFYLGSCTFCATCMDFCGHGAIEFTRDYHMGRRHGDQAPGRRQARPGALQVRVLHALRQEVPRGRDCGPGQ